MLEFKQLTYSRMTFNFNLYFYSLLIDITLHIYIYISLFMSCKCVVHHLFSKQHTPNGSTEEFLQFHLEPP